MRNKDTNSTLVKRMTIGVFVLTPILFGLGYLLEDTEYKSIAPLLGGIAWLIYVILTIKYFLRMFKNLYK